MAAASTPWVVFIDDDCLAPGGWLTDIGRRLDSWSAEQVGVAGGTVVEPKRPGRIYGFMRDLNYMSSGDTFKVRPGGIPSLGGANLAVSRRCWTSVGGFDETLPSTEDFDLLVRATKAGWRLGTYFDAPAVVHVHHTDWLTFLRRYHTYGRGVAQTVSSNGLDARAHRVYVDGSLRSVWPAVRRFAQEDLRWLESNGAQVSHATRGLAFARAVAWQAGAWRAA